MNHEKPKHAPSAAAFAFAASAGAPAGAALRVPPHRGGGGADGDAPRQGRRGATAGEAQGPGRAAAPSLPGLARNDA